MILLKLFLLMPFLYILANSIILFLLITIFLFFNILEILLEIKNELDGFAKAHHLKEVKGLTGSKKKISLEAKINSNKLSQLFKDYNMLFDIFFTSTKIEAGNLFFDLMDAFNNSLLIVGPKDLLERIEKKIAKKTKSEVLFEYVDSFKQN